MNTAKKKKGTLVCDFEAPRNNRLWKSTGEHPYDAWIEIDPMTGLMTGKRIEPEDQEKQE